MRSEILALTLLLQGAGSSLAVDPRLFLNDHAYSHRAPLPALPEVPCGSKLFMKPSFPGRSHRAATCYVSLDQAGLGRIRKYRWASSPAWGRCDYKQQDRGTRSKCQMAAESPPPGRPLGTYPRKLPGSWGDPQPWRPFFPFPHTPTSTLSTPQMQTLLGPRKAGRQQNRKMGC